MREFKDVLFETEHLLDCVVRPDFNARFHIIWDAAAALLRGVKSEAYTDVIGGLMIRLKESNSGCHDVYFPGEYEEKIFRKDKLSVTLTTNARLAWDYKEEVDEINKWLRQYEYFVQLYRFGKSHETMGDYWNQLIEKNDSERLDYLVNGLTLLHDEIMPIFKSELKEIIKEYFVREVEDEKALYNDYKVVRKIQLDMIKFLKKERTYICTDEFCYKE